MNKEDLFLNYEQLMKTARADFDKATQTILYETNERTLLLFWINFCALGVGMTESVERWIRSAGEKCQVLGYAELGKLLIKHAGQEADHDLMMVEDTKNLINLWNKLFQDKLSTDTFYKEKDNSLAVKAYQHLHENIIASSSPFGQITVEYEIENLSVEYGAKILMHTKEYLGPSILEHLSFVEHHIALDEGHTHFNRRALSRFLEAYPETLPSLVQSGKNALSSYAAFILECYERSKNYTLNHKNEINAHA